MLQLDQVVLGFRRVEKILRSGGTLELPHRVHIPVARLASQHRITVRLIRG